MHHHPIEPLEPRQLLATTPVVDLLVDSNRDGLLTAADDLREDAWSSGKSGRGAVILPNLDKDNTTPNGAPDNWPGGNWLGRPAAPNNVIDNAADLADIGRLRMRMLNVDDPYNYRVTLQILKPTTDPAWLKSTPADSRVRLFFPTRELNGNLVPQAGDAAVLGAGLGDTIRFVNNPAGPDEYSVADLAGSGYLEFGIEGIKTGAQVRIRLTVEYDPILTDSGPAGGGIDDGPTETPPVIDEVALRVAPLVLQDNRQRAEKVIVENMNRYGLDNAAARATLKQAFGNRLIESQTGDLWQQDGYEIGYAKSPYGQMPVVLELPRARDTFFDPKNTMRSFVRSKLLAPGVGVNTELANSTVFSPSSFGGDIESLHRPGQPAGAPGFLVASDMPAYMKDFFAAQGANPLLNLKLDDWLGVAHVDEVVHLAPSGNKLLVADADLAWALTLLAAKLDPNVRMLPGMNGNDQLPDYTPDGVKASALLANALFRRQNLDFAQPRLRTVHDTLRTAMGLTDEIFAPLKNPANTGTASLLRGGAFTQLLSGLRRTFEIRFLDNDRYQLRYRDAGSATDSKWFDGRKSRDEVFPEAKAYLLKTYFAGNPKSGDRFTFATNPDATLIKVPVLFATGGVFFEDPAFPSDPASWRLGAFSTNSLNSISDGETIVAGKAYGPKVALPGTNTKSDLFESYTTSTFRSAGYKNILFTDSRLYHDSGGNLHCGTNVFRALPTGKWWET